MSNGWLLTIVIVAGLCGCEHIARAQVPDRQAPDRAVERPSSEQAPDPKPTVDRIMRPWIAAQRPPGTMVVVRRAAQTHFFSFGVADRARGVPVTPQTIFELASVTKVFTTTSLALEVEAGRMQLQDSVARYIPLLEEQGRDIKRVTLEHLATHTSSLPHIPEIHRSDREWNKQLVLEWAARWQAPHPPGSQNLYSNVAIGLLGHAIEDFEGEPLLEVWRRQFLNPLGMHHTFFHIPEANRALVAQGYSPQGKPIEHTPTGGWPAGGRLSSSGHDMAAFLVANLGERPDVPVITAAMQFAQRPYFKVSPKMTQGLAWQRLHVAGHLVVDKNGGLDGTSTYIGMMPEKHVGVVILANRGKCQATPVGRELLTALVAESEPSATAESP